jgi:hypothetical protein
MRRHEYCIIAKAPEALNTFDLVSELIASSRANKSAFTITVHRISTSKRVWIRIREIIVMPSVLV